MSSLYCQAVVPRATCCRIIISYFQAVVPRATRLQDYIFRQRATWHVSAGISAVVPRVLCVQDYHTKNFYKNCLIIPRCRAVCDGMQTLRAWWEHGEDYQGYRLGSDVTLHLVWVFINSDPRLGTLVHRQKIVRPTSGKSATHLKEIDF